MATIFKAPIKLEILKKSSTKKLKDKPKGLYGGEDGSTSRMPPRRSLTLTRRWSKRHTLKAGALERTDPLTTRASGRSHREIAHAPPLGTRVTGIRSTGSTTTAARGRGSSTSLKDRTPTTSLARTSRSDDEKISFYYWLICLSTPSCGHSFQPFLHCFRCELLFNTPTRHLQLLSYRICIINQHSTSLTSLPTASDKKNSHFTNCISTGSLLHCWVTWRILLFYLYGSLYTFLAWIDGYLPMLGLLPPQIHLRKFILRLLYLKLAIGIFSFASELSFEALPVPFFPNVI